MRRGTETACAFTLMIISAGGMAQAQPVGSGETLSTLDSGLRDCEIPFAELRVRAQSCVGQTPTDGRRCETYSPSQFSEVVALSTPAGPYCTATLISPSWVVTAARCFVGDRKTSEVAAPGADYILEQPSDISVTAFNAVLLPKDQRVRAVKRAIVYRHYGGKGEQAPWYANDLALVEISAPYPSDAVEPAQLAALDSFSTTVTIAGYGYSNVGGGTTGRFNLTWPALITPAGREFRFVPTPQDISAFCQGDSGGPVFVGRNRGCRPTDAAGEARPRSVQGTISFNIGGAFSAGAGVALQWAQSCMNASLMAMQNITLRERRDWICETTNRQAGGC